MLCFVVVYSQFFVDACTPLTHWSRNEISIILQTTFSNAFSWMKIYWFRIKIPLKFISNGSINNILALVQIMAWRRSGDEPLSESIMIILLTHKCVTRPKWVHHHPQDSLELVRMINPGLTFIKPDQLDPWINDQIKITLMSTISSLHVPNFVSCGRDKPSHMIQNLVTVGTELWTAEHFLADPWPMDQADLVW